MWQPLPDTGGLKSMSKIAQTHLKMEKHLYRLLRQGIHPLMLLVN